MSFYSPPLMIRDQFCRRGADNTKRYFMSETSINQDVKKFLGQQVPPGMASWQKSLSRFLDRLVYKDEEEFLDSSHVPMETRLSLVEDLSRLNDRSGYHHAFLRRLEGLIKTLPKRPTEQPLSILDVGVGGGGLLRVIHRWAKRKRIQVELFGVDLCKEFSQIAQSRLSAEGILATLFQGDACSLKDFEDRSFDLVVSNYMVHHIRSTDKVGSFFSEVNRIARQGWLVVDLDRRLYGPLFVLLAGFLLKAPRILIQDGIKSARRAYRWHEINSLLNEMRKIKKIDGMLCRPHSFFPYWMVKGSRSP